MVRLWCALLLVTGVLAFAQPPCAPQPDNEVRRIRAELMRIPIGDMDMRVPPEASRRITELKEAVTCAVDAIVSGAAIGLEAAALEAEVARLLSSKDQADDAFAGRTAVIATRPAASPAALTVDIEMGITCGSDHMLLVYLEEKGHWKRLLRWQAPALTQSSDAFGDFFLSALLMPPLSGDQILGPRMVVAHGTPWCTSRMSAFAIDVLAPTLDPNSPQVVWHTRRGYSRGNYTPKLTASGDTFELRVSRNALDLDHDERRVIYKYRLNPQRGVRRIGPLRVHARGFVEEWISAPWEEAEGLTDPASSATLRQVHSETAGQQGKNAIFHHYGPVTKCKAPGVFQVAIRMDSQNRPLPTRYFRVRESDQGYMMLAAPTQPNPTCAGPDLMPK